MLHGMRCIMTSQDRAAGERGQSRGDAPEVDDVVTEGTGEDYRERIARTNERLDDLMDDIDELLRSVVDLDKNAPDELFTERAALMVAQYQNKGGQ